MARNIPRGRETQKARKLLLVFPPTPSATRRKSEAHGKLFPSAVIFFASIRHTATNWKGLFFENFFLYLCFPRKLDYFAIIIKSCNDTGFHTPCVCANTTPLSMYSVTLPNEYKAFPSKRRLGIGINSRLFSSA